MALTNRLKTLISGKAGAAPAPVAAKLAAARQALAVAQDAFDAAALALDEVPADQSALRQDAAKRFERARVDRDKARERIELLERAQAGATARTAAAEAQAQRKARRELVESRRAALQRIQDAAAEAASAEDAYVAARVNVQRIVDESLTLFPDGTRAAIGESNLYVVPALFQKMHAAGLPYAGIKILLPTGAPMWRERLPSLDHAEAK